jgi:hypothetical protein
MMQSARKERAEAGVGCVQAGQVEKRMAWNSCRCRASSPTPAGKNPWFFTITARTRNPEPQRPFLAVHIASPLQFDGDDNM